jgi:predicted RND superfamily exporter protein
MTTEPKTPTAGSSNSTSIVLRIVGVNGDHPADVPIMMRMVKDGIVLQTTNPIIVPSGHYTHEFTFTQAGKYVLYVDLNDKIYSGEVLTFTFFINVSGPFDYLYIAYRKPAEQSYKLGRGMIRNYRLYYFFSPFLQ